MLQNINTINKLLTSPSSHSIRKFASVATSVNIPAPKPVWEDEPKFTKVFF
jgi:hypothetical protein